MEKLNLAQWQHDLEEPTPNDIDSQGQKIYSSDSSNAARLAKNIVKLHANGTFARSHAKLEDHGEASEDDQDQNQDRDAENRENRNPTPPDADATLLATMRIKTEMDYALRCAKGEIDVALDVVNLLIAAAKPHVEPPQPLALPRKALATTFIKPLKPPKLMELEAARLNFAAKKQQLLAASEGMREGAAKLQSVETRDHLFWKKAMALRESNWIMQMWPRPQATNLPPAFYINYGLSDGFPSSAQVGRDYTAENIGETSENFHALDLTTSHPIAHERRFTLQNGREVTQGESSVQLVDPRNRGQEDIDMEAPDESNQDLPSVEKLDALLISAQSTLFEQELYLDLMRGASSVTRDVISVENKIVMTVDPDRKLVVEWSPKKEGKRTRPSISTEVAELHGGSLEMTAAKIALQLSLRRNHHLHTEKRRCLAMQQGSTRSQLAVTDKLTRPLVRVGIPVALHFKPSASGRHIAQQREQPLHSGHMLPPYTFMLTAPHNIVANTVKGPVELRSLRDFIKLLAHKISRDCLLSRICDEANLIDYNESVDFFSSIKPSAEHAAGEGGSGGIGGIGEDRSMSSERSSLRRNDREARRRWELHPEAKAVNATIWASSADGTSAVNLPLRVSATVVRRTSSNASPAANQSNVESLVETRPSWYFDYQITFAHNTVAPRTLIVTGGPTSASTGAFTATATTKTTATSSYSSSPPFEERVQEMLFSFL